MITPSFECTSSPMCPLAHGHFYRRCLLPLRLDASSADLHVVTYNVDGLCETHLEGRSTRAIELILPENGPRPDVVMLQEVGSAPRYQVKNARKCFGTADWSLSPCLFSPGGSGHRATLCEQVRASATPLEIQPMLQEGAFSGTAKQALEAPIHSLCFPWFTASSRAVSSRRATSAARPRCPTCRTSRCSSPGRPP